jgi:hypothetical protein
MTSQHVTLIDRGQQVVATAQVTERDGHFAGRIDLSRMPVALKRLFAEYEDVVQTQTFGLLDAIEDKIAALHLAGVFEDGRKSAIFDVQIYPSTKNVSFHLVKEAVSPSSSA